MNVDHLFRTISVTSQMARDPWKIQFPEQTTLQFAKESFTVYGILTVLPARLFLQPKTYGFANLVNNGTYPKNMR